MASAKSPPISPSMSPKKGRAFGFTCRMRRSESTRYTPTGAASNSAEALRFIEALRPDVTLVDIDLGAESGFAVAEQLHHAPPATSLPVIMISTHDEQDFADMITASPALGFVPKSALTADAIRNLVESSARVEEGDHC